MININKILVKVLILFFYFLTTHSYGSIEFNKIKQSIYHCFDNSSDCQHIKVPIELNDEIDESILSIDKFLGQNYLLMTLKYNSTPNKCYSLYEIKNHIIQTKEKQILSDGSQLCDYKKTNDQLINRFLDGGKWYEKLYKEKEKYYQIILEDQCIDCDMVQRKIYNKNLNYLLVTNEHNLFDRKPIIKKIAVNQAYLYDDALEKSKTKMYLIEDDKVELLQYRDGFYQIRYLTRTQKLIVKWVHSSALQAH
jgi:hypothetical protein